MQCLKYVILIILALNQSIVFSSSSQTGAAFFCFCIYILIWRIDLQFEIRNSIYKTMNIKDNNK